MDQREVDSPAPKKKKTLGIIGLILGIFSIIMFFLLFFLIEIIDPLINYYLYLIVLLPLLGFLLCIIQQKKNPTKLAKGAVILNIVLFFINLIIVFVLLQPIGPDYHPSGAIDMTDNQLREYAQSLFSDNPDSKVVIIPSGQILKIKQGRIDEIGIGIKNKLSESQANQAYFAYEISEIREDDLIDCGIKEEILMSWISREEVEGIRIPFGKTYNGRIRIEIPENAPFCTLGFELSFYVDKDGEGTEFEYEEYSNPEQFDIVIK